MCSAGESIESIGKRSEFVASNSTRPSVGVAENAHSGEVMHSHRIEWTPSMDRAHVERAGWGWEFARPQSDDLGRGGDPPQVPCRIGVIGGSPPASEVDLVLGAAHPDEVPGCGEVGSGCWRSPTVYREPVEAEHGDRRECEDAEEDPGGHLDEARPERPRRECR